MTKRAHRHKLWLDDCRTPPSEEWHWCKTADEAMDYLAGFYVSEVSLDHDLGSDFDPVPAKTGYEVACYIEAEARAGRLPRLKWRVHSANPVGLERMMAVLGNANRAWNTHDAEEETA